MARVGEAREDFAWNVQVWQLGGNVVTDVDLRQVYDEEMARQGQEIAHLTEELGRIHTKIAMHEDVAKTARA